MFPFIAKYSKSVDVGFRLSWPLSHRRSFIKLVSDCSTCSQECQIHDQLPTTMQKKIDQGDLYGSVKPYKQHLILPEFEIASKWPSNVEEMSGSMSESAKSALKGSKQGIIVTAYNDDQSTLAMGQTYVFPAGIQFQGLTPSNMKILTDWMLDPIYPCILEHSPILHDALVLICAHKLRDKRCGVAGPMLLKEFQKEIAEQSQNIRVLAVSHVGGHKFAGNVIVYRKDERNIWVADWYGRVRTCHVKGMVDCIRRGETIKDLWRGQFNAEESDPALDW